MKFIFTTFLMVLTLGACQQKQLATKNAVSVLQYDFAIVNMSNISKEDLLYKLKEVKLEGNFLYVDVEYSGGCVKPHVFSLVTNGLVRKDGVMEFAVLHKTKDDKCKALLTENIAFDISSIINLQSQKLKELELNNDMVVLLE